MTQYKAKAKREHANDSGLNFDAQLWAAADKMRGHMDAWEYNGARLEAPTARIEYDGIRSQAPTARFNASPGQRPGKPETPFCQALKGRFKPCPNPKEHHRTKSFQEEYRAFLERHGVAYDEKNVWD